MAREGFGNTLKVAALLCVACSVVVATAAVGLRPLQQANKRQDQKKNVLMAAGLFVDGENESSEVDSLYEANVEEVLIDLATGEPADPNVVDPAKYDPRKASKDAELSKPIEPPTALGGIKTREKYAFVYRVKGESGAVEKIVLPIYGKGLWSTLYGFLAVGVDANTVQGITFYEHGETPGLGGEIESEGFKDDWPGRKLYDAEGNVAIVMVKGGVAEDDLHGIDALSGATITSNGVEELVHYWAGPDGFGPYLESLSAGGEGETGG